MPPTVPPRLSPVAPPVAGSGGSPGKVTAPKIAPPAAKAGNKPGAWKTILLVDPDVENRQRVIALLRE
jgi:hypothetical protein